VIVRYLFFFLNTSKSYLFTYEYSFLFYSIALTKRTTQIWFQNARARMKKKPCATTSSPPIYAALTNNNLNLVDSLHLSSGQYEKLDVIGFYMIHFIFLEQQIDPKMNHLQWSPSQTSPASSLIYDGENSNDEYSTGYI